MDEEDKKDKLSPREIKYQIGWSRGRIRSKDEELQGQPGQHSGSSTVQHRSEQPRPQHAAGGVSAGTAAHSGTFTYRGMHRESFAERVVWRGLPAVPARWMTALLWAVPALGFAITYALVIALTRAP